jgi:hypothetical protein
MRQGTKPLREGSKLDRQSILEAEFEVLDIDGSTGLELSRVRHRVHDGLDRI